MANTQATLLGKLDTAVLAAHAAFNACPIGDPHKTELARQRNIADSTYLQAIIGGLEAGSDAVDKAAERLDKANQAVNAALASAQETAKVLAAVKQAVGFAIQLAHLAAAVAVA